MVAQKSEEGHRHANDSSAQSRSSAGLSNKDVELTAEASARPTLRYPEILSTQLHCSAMSLVTPGCGSTSARKAESTWAAAHSAPDTHKPKRGKLRTRMIWPRYLIGFVSHHHEAIELVTRDCFNCCLARSGWHEAGFNRFRTHVGLQVVLEGKGRWITELTQQILSAGFAE